MNKVTYPDFSSMTVCYEYLSCELRTSPIKNKTNKIMIKKETSLHNRFHAMCYNIMLRQTKSLSQAILRCEIRTNMYKHGQIWSYRGARAIYWDVCNVAWWRHQMESFSALLAICAGNSPVPGEFPAQRPVTRSFDLFFHLCPNKRLSKQSWGWWFETPSRPLWRHRNGLRLSVPILRSLATDRPCFGF